MKVIELHCKNSSDQIFNSDKSLWTIKEGLTMAKLLSSYSIKQAAHRLDICH